MQQVASAYYGISDADLNGKVFKHLRNRVYSTHSAMRVYEKLAKHGQKGVRRVMHQSVRPV